MKTLRICYQSTGGGGFLTVVSEMAERGYCIEWKVYNSKDYGVPQNRERVYIIGCYGKRRSGNLLPVKRENTTTLKQIIGGSQGERVYNPNGVSCTLSAQGGGMGAKTGLYEIDTNKVQSIGNGSRYETDNTVWPAGLAGTLTATDYKHVPKVAIKNATKQGYIMAEIGDGIDLAYPDSETRRGRVQPQRSNTLTTSDNLGVLVDDEPIRIRKLTPKECWRLQGFTDEQYEKAATVNSNSQLYKQAGNAVTVNVVEEIGKHIMKVNAYGGDDEKRYIG